MFLGSQSRAPPGLSCCFFYPKPFLCLTVPRFSKRALRITWTHPVKSFLHEVRSPHTTGRPREDLLWDNACLVTFWCPTLDLELPSLPQSLFHSSYVLLITSGGKLPVSCGVNSLWKETCPCQDGRETCPLDMESPTHTPSFPGDTWVTGFSESGPNHSSHPKGPLPSTLVCQSWSWAPVWVG